MRKWRVLLWEKKIQRKFYFISASTIQLGAKVLGINPCFHKKKLQNYVSFIKLILFYDKDFTEFARNWCFTQKPIFFRPATMTLTSGSTGLPKAVVHNVQAHLIMQKGYVT